MSNHNPSGLKKDGERKQEKLLPYNKEEMIN
jgi:hypothetical protein